MRSLGDEKRRLLVVPQIDAILDGHVYHGLFPATETERLVGVFSAGQLVTVSRKFTKKKPDVEQIVGLQEVWALCARRPKPGWRLLGRWFAKDVFIALRAWDKTELFGKYPAAGQDVIDDWMELFGNQPAHSGPNVGDYLGGVFRDVDESP